MTQDNRYIRQLALPEVGTSGQDKISRSKVLVVGCGGLGSAVLPYLAGAGIGTIGLADGDCVSEHNLARQVLFTEDDIGKQKVSCAAQKLIRLNSGIQVVEHNAYLTVENAIDLINRYDVIVDATDRIAARYLINDACVLSNKPFVHAALYRFQSQISVFNYKGGPTYRCLYPTAPTMVQSCDIAGILGTSVAIAGGLQANEVMKIILGVGHILSGQLLLNNFLTNEQRLFTFQKNSEIDITATSFKNEHTLRCINYTTLALQPHILLDVRTSEEKPHIDSSDKVQIPLDTLEKSLHLLPKETTIGIFCQRGSRSKDAYRILKNEGYTHMYCLNETANQLQELIPT